MGKDLNFLGTQMPEVDIEKCIACGKCMEICPDGAIKLEKH
jgi:NAD-dependent dihydropyrimidine dehydrogenase PreA subunit